MLLFVFLISIAVLLLCIIKIKLNAFVALLVCAYGTGLMALATYAGGGAPENFASIADVTACVTSNFGSTLGSIGIVTGLGVMLGMFMYESGGIDNIVDKVRQTAVEKVPIRGVRGTEAAGCRRAGADHGAASDPRRRADGGARLPLLR